MSKFIEQYDNMMDVKNWTEATKRTYRSLLLKFLADHKNKNIQRLTTDEIVAYIASQHSRASMAQMYGVLKNLYFHVFQQKRKFGFVPFPKREERLRHLPTHDQLMQAIQEEDNAKHRLILLMMYGTGIRLHEVVKLKWSDIRREKDEINPLSLFVRGKGNKDRIVPLSQAIHDELMRYCKEYKLDSTCKDCYIFEGVNGLYSVRSVAKIVERAGDRIGFKLTPHLLRHACFQYLADSGVELPYIGQIAGHKSPLTTMIYARMKPQKVKMPV